MRSAGFEPAIEWPQTARPPGSQGILLDVANEEPHDFVDGEIFAVNGKGDGICAVLRMGKIR